LLRPGVNERRRQAFFPMLSVIGHPSEDKPQMMDVRQSGSGPHRTGPRGDAWHRDPTGPLLHRTTRDILVPSPASVVTVVDNGARRVSHPLSYDRGDSGHQ